MRDALDCGRECDDGGIREEITLAANASGFGSAGSVEVRCLFEAELVALADNLPEADAKRGKHLILKTGLSTIVESPAGPNATGKRLPRRTFGSSQATLR